jgi:hypothetical protein
MNELMHDLGENYEYVRVMVENHLEIKKLDLIEKSARLAGLGVLAFFILLLGLLILLALSAIAIMLLTSILESQILGLLAFIGFTILTGVFLFVFRKPLVLAPTQKLFFSIIQNI